MDYFNYKNGILHVEDLSINNIARSIETPFYCYSSTSMRKNYNDLSNSLSKLNTSIFYAIKANSNLAIIKLFSDLGAGADVVSEGEIRRALKVGIPNNKIIFSGVGKTKKEISFALNKEILQINIESESELELINQTALELNKKANVAFRINPDIEVNTHEKITTGKKENKFGIPWPEAKEVFIKASKMKNINVIGLAIHIGSQLLDLSPLEKAFKIVMDATNELLELGINVKNIDLGGGLGVKYVDEKPPNFNDYADIIKKNIDYENMNIFIEPGRRLVANAGILVTKVIYVKNNGKKTFLIVDAAMNDLLRPSLYDAVHQIKPIQVRESKNKKSFDIVGPICESGDILAKNIMLDEILPEELLSIHSAGAYGSAMSSNYNSRLLVPEILVQNRDFAIIRKRPTYDEMLKIEKLAKWQV
ncbi:MAG: Diaminopimelate decarboxylase [Alphaproteobacteria bacterium MarineAlpha2_Bin1]|nr:MAG: Diaminopimelate decarboxylase [Alphaproteobacteria bacterium MarineAlpha2_Bin1]|tara:strand:- start:471 stop:1730 length:1260 start_codon:yes stop_codon:yes gene_type:complete